MFIRTERFNNFNFCTKFLLANSVDCLYKRFALLYSAPWNKPLSLCRFILTFAEKNSIITQYDKINRDNGYLTYDSVPIIF